MKSGGTQEEDMAPSARGWGALGGREDPGDKVTHMWPLQRARLEKGLIKRLALEVNSGHHPFPEHRGLGVERWRRTACARYCSKHVTYKFNPHSNPIRWSYHCPILQIGKLRHGEVIRFA